MNLHNRLYLATIADDAAEQALIHGLGLELDEFCTAANMDENFSHWDALVRRRMQCADRFVFHAPFAELSPCAIDPLVRSAVESRLLQAAELSLRYGVRRMVVHSGFIPQIYFPVWFTEQSAIFFRSLLSKLPADIELLIENVMDPDPQPLADLVQAIGDSRVGICFDLGHANAVSQFPVRSWLRTLAPHIRHLHVHDNMGEHDTHDLPGDGNIGFPVLFSDLFSAVPDATVTLECLDAAAAVRRMEEYHLF